MKERVGDAKLIIISMTVSGINDHTRFYSLMLCTTAINTSNTIRTQTAAAERSIRAQQPNNEYLLKGCEGNCGPGGK